MNKRKWLAIVLALAMVLTMMPAMAMADETVNDDEGLKNAINNASGKTTITLGANIDCNVEIPAGKDIIIDLAGHKLTNVDNHTITNNGTLEITDSVGGGIVDNITHAKGALYNKGIVTLNGGTFKRSGEAGTYEPYGNGDNSWYTIANYGTMTINEGVTVENSGGYSSMILNGGGTKGRLIINGGEFDGGINTVKNDSGGTLTINDGIFKNTTQHVIMNWNEATIKGGEFRTLDSATAVLFTSYWPTGEGEETCNGELIIEGGNFITTTDSQIILQDAYQNNDQYKGTASISGGTFSKDPGEEYLADGFKLSANGTVKKISTGYVPQKTLTFDTNGGSKIDAVTANYGKTIVLADYTPKRSGYDFVGWYKDEKLKEKIEYAILDYDMTVYAKWSANGEPTEDADVETKIVLVINDKTAVVDGKAVSNDVAPLIVNGRTYTPARFVAEALGAKVVWNEPTKTVTITKGDTSIVLIVDTTTAYVNGKAVKMDASAFIADGRTFTPSRFVAEQLGANVEWDEATRTVTIIQYAE